MRIKVFQEVLKAFSGAEIEAAFITWFGRGKQFPVPADIAEIIRVERIRNMGIV